ncbi:MAG TPA: LuxR family transcriptional regulator [Phycisphaerales bacterium]|nr:LuxR family transcriptional regulator [Phycisphaerales bacterium]
MMENKSEYNREAGSQSQCAAPEGAEAVLWKTIESHPFIGASIVNTDGYFVCANDRAKIMYLGTANVEVAGRRMGEVVSEDWAKERIELMKELEREDKNGFLRHIRRGRSLLVTYSKIPTPEGQPTRYLVLIGECGDENLKIGPEYKIMKTGLVNLGPLSSLTKREIEVLALIAKGMTTDEIAKQLNRSPKTIEAHRSSLARKLGVKNRVQLAEFAMKASLDPHHADLKRIPDKSN